MGLRRGMLLWVLAIAAITGCQAPEARSESSAADGPGPRTAPETNVPGPVIMASVPPSGATAARARPGGEEREAIESRCGVDELRRYINAKLTDAVKAEIAKAAGQRAVRYIRPGDMVTMDFSAERLNVHIGPDERIVDLRCG